MAAELCLYDNSTPFKCIDCSRYVLFDELYVSPNCFIDNQTDHYYCIHCSSKIINESLSLLNETPKCIISNCNKSFNVSLSKVVNRKLLKRYQMSHDNISKYKNDEFLLHGYIRHNTKSNILFPTDIIALIHDFYKLVFFTELPCDNCNSSGFDKCLMCDGEGKYTSTCTFCTNGSISKPCPDCENGKQKIRAGCRCFLNYYAVCRSCDGFGWRAQSYTSKKIKCTSCNGLGNFCDCMATCDSCKGSGKLSKELTCSLCNGKGNTTLICSQCDGSSKMECYKCQSDGSLFYTDFNKVISKQSYCHKCNVYKPNHDIIFWSGCGHTYCYTCIVNSDRGAWPWLYGPFVNLNVNSNYIEKELSLFRIPVCQINNCKQELMEEDLTLIYKYSGARHGSFYWNDDVHLSNLVSQMQDIKFKEQNFSCLFCGMWHAKQEMLKLSACGCACTSKCLTESIQDDINNKYIPFCHFCNKNIKMDDIESICGKQYVHVVETLQFYKRFEKLITRQRTKIKTHEVLRVLKLRNEELNYDCLKLSKTIIDFLMLTSIKLEDIEYLNIIPTKRRTPLFQLFLRDETIAQNIYGEIINLKQKNVLYNAWNVGFWEIFNQQANINNYKPTNERQYDHQINNVVQYTSEQVRKTECVQYPTQCTKYIQQQQHQNYIHTNNHMMSTNYFYNNGRYNAPQQQNNGVYIHNNYNNNSSLLTNYNYNNIYYGNNMNMNMNYNHQVNQQGVTYENNSSTSGLVCGVFKESDLYR